MNKLFNKLSKMQKVSLISLASFLLLAIGFIDWITGTDLSISIFYLIPIAICAWYINNNAGLVFAFISTVIWFFSDFFDSTSYSQPITPYWNTLVMLGLFILVSVLLSKLKSVFDRENTMALNIQKSLLPQKNPEISGYKIFSIWEPTKVVSGDYYDFINLPENNFGITLADVCGHGFPAALLMSNVQAAFRIIASHNHPTNEVCEQLNNIMYNYTMLEKITTFFYGILNPTNKQLVYANAGHPPPIIMRGETEIINLSNVGLLLGVDPKYKYEQASVQFEKGDVILFYTDGIIETRNAAGEQFGENRLIDFCRKNIHLPQNNFRTNLLSTLNKFSNDNIDDDVTLIVISVE